MLALTHALTGAALAKLAPTPESGLLMAVFSHPLLDYLPHWDLRTRHTRQPVKYVVIISLADALIGFFLGWLLFRNSVPFWQLSLTMFAAQLPDWLEAPYTVFHWHFPPFSTVKRFQHLIHHKIKFPEGLYTQLIVIFFFLLLSRS